MIALGIEIGFKGVETEPVLKSDLWRTKRYHPFTVIFNHHDFQHSLYKQTYIKQMDFSELHIK